MIAFVCGLLSLVCGYVFYGRLTQSAIRPDPERVTPAVARADGVDYVAMSTWRVYLVQLLNIAGLGPVFGPILGALWGPQVFLWVVFGCILGGTVHDFLVGAMSIRNDGAGLPNLIGHPKVLVVGIGGLRADALDVLLAEGRVPNLQALIDEGSYANHAQASQINGLRAVVVRCAPWRACR